MEKTFYFCIHCGNLFGAIVDSGVTPVCCGESMQKLKPNSTDAAGEKHVPLITRNGNRVTVQVGEVAHPMEEKHYITWICLTQNSKTQRVALQPGDAPKAEFIVDHEQDPVTVYEYCNLHGLWTNQG